MSQTLCTRVINEKLDCKKDDREEALSCDKHVVGIFKRDGTLIGYMSIV